MKVEAKNELREKIAFLKKKYSTDQLSQMSVNVIENLTKLQSFKDSKTILLYYSMPDEVDTSLLIESYKMNKRIILPIVTKAGLILREYTSEQNIKISRFGIKEPIGEDFLNYDEIDFAIIPGVAFDRSLNRLGRGKGYYDRLLPKINAYKTAICFDFQIVDSVPVDAHDKTIDSIVSETYVI